MSAAAAADANAGAGANDVHCGETRVKQMIDIQARALDLFARKNRDYGDAFAKFGVIGVLMRIEDKIQRSLSITKNAVQLVKDERIEDTLLDLHNYAAMALMLLAEGSDTDTDTNTDTDTDTNKS